MKRKVSNTFINLTIVVVAIVLIFIVIMVDQKNTERNRVYNIDMRIVGINSDCSLTSDKFHNPQLCNTVLFETISEPKLYVEINTCNKPGRIKIDVPWLYNHKAGDIVHFDYLLKDLFFTINR